MVSIATVSGMDCLQAQTFIDEEARVHEKRLSELKKLRNSLATIIKLPDELLLEIFSHVQKLSSGILKEWHQITHVCQHWRNVAVGAPTLWTKPVTKPHEYTLIFLARSRAAELELCLDGKIDSETCIALLTEINRVKSFIMDHASTPFLRWLQEEIPHLGNNASRLRELAIRIEPQRHDNSGFIFSGSIFADPKDLQILQLANLNLDWNIFPQPNLTVLYLVDVKPTSPLSWQQFMNTLSEMPLLEDVVFNVHALQLHDPADVVEAIRFPRLRQLVVDGCSLQSISYFLSRLVLPLLHEAVILCNRHQNFSNADYSKIAQVISTLISGGDFGALRDICVTFGYYSLALDIIEHGRRQKSITFSLPGRNDEMGIDENGLDARIIRTFLDGITALPRNSIVELVLNAALNAEEILELFGSLPRLESIKAYEYSAIGLVGSLKIPLSHSENAPIPFKHVQSLTLSEQQDMLDQTLLDYPYGRHLWEDLCDSLMQRYEYGSPMHHLSVGCYYIRREELKPLHEIVVNVDYPKPPWRLDDDELIGYSDSEVDGFFGSDDDA